MRLVTAPDGTEEGRPRPSPSPGRLELTLELGAEMITMIRKFIESLYGHVYGGELASRVGLAAHELMDNAARCAHMGEVTMSIEVTGDAIEVCTRNRARPHDIAALTGAVDEMRSHDDALSYYLELMKRTAGRKDSSGLGLGRIWAEADMALSYEACADMVSIRARMHLAAPGSES